MENYIVELIMKGIHSYYILHMHTLRAALLTCTHLQQKQILYCSHFNGIYDFVV